MRKNSLSYLSKEKVLFCANCLKPVLQSEIKWVERQDVVDEMIKFVWYQKVCKECYEILKKQIRKDLVKEEYEYIEEE